MKFSESDFKEPHSFKTHKNDFDVEITLIGVPSSSALPIQTDCMNLKVVLEKETMEVFKRIIDHSYFQTEKGLGSFIKTPKNLFDSLKRVFDTKVDISLNGNLTFTIDVEQLDISFQYKIETTPEPHSELELATKRIARLEQRLTQNNSLMVQQIIAAQEKAEQRLSKLEEEKLILCHENEELRLVQQRLRTSLNQIVKGLIWRGIISATPQIKEISDFNKDQLAQIYSKQVQQASKVQPMLQNPHLNHFCSRVHIEGQRLRNHVIKQETTWKTFIASRPIYESCTYHIQLHKISERNFCLGLGTRTMFGLTDACHRDYVRHSFHEDQNLFDNSLIQMRINLEKQRVYWFRDGWELHQEQLPLFMREQVLYFMVHFNFKNDSFTFWVN